MISNTLLILKINLIKTVNQEVSEGIERVLSSVTNFLDVVCKELEQLFGFQAFVEEVLNLESVEEGLYH